MAKLDVYKQDGKKDGSMNVPDALFRVPQDTTLIHQVVVAQEANNRVRIAQAKDRSEKRGGGRKPWRQKGTGRARHGSRRSPIWIGGGVTFGPTKERTYTKKVNKKMKRKALAMVLSDKVRENWLIAVDSLALPEPKTKHAANLRDVLPGSESSALFVTAPGDEYIVRATRNLKNTDVISAASLNVRDLLKYKYLIASKPAIELIKKTYSA